MPRPRWEFVTEELLGGNYWGREAQVGGSLRGPLSMNSCAKRGKDNGTQQRTDRPSRGLWGVHRQNGSQSPPRQGEGTSHPYTHHCILTALGRQGEWCLAKWSFQPRQPLRGSVCCWGSRSTALATSANPEWHFHSVYYLQATGDSCQVTHRPLREG